MRRATRWGRWLAGVAAALGVGLAGAPPGAEPLRTGTKDVALVGGYSLSHNELVGNVSTIEGYDLVSHFGYFLRVGRRRRSAGSRPSAGGCSSAARASVRMWRPGSASSSVIS